MYITHFIALLPHDVILISKDEEALAQKNLPVD
jgi:hypothetical protein